MHVDKNTHHSVSTSRASRLYVVRVYSWLAVLSLGVFGIFNVLSGDGALGYVELAGSAVLFINMLSLRQTGKLHTAVVIYLATILVYMALMSITGGTEGTGIFWLFMFPVTAFFLAGKRAGLWWMGAFVVMVAVVWFLAATSHIHIAYGAVALRQVLISVLVLAAGIYAYQRSHEALQVETDTSEKALQTEQVRADVILQSMGEGIVVVDAAGRTLSVNEAAEKILGWSASELIGKDFITTVPMLTGTGSVFAAEDRPLSQAFRSGQPTTMTTIYRRKDGAAIPVSVTGTPVIVGGKAVGGISTFRDISEEQGVARAKSQFVTLVSHQLRTPISAISWMSELLLNGDTGALLPEQRQHIEDIYQSNQRMAALVSEMLVVSSLDSNTLEVTPQNIDVKALSSSVVAEQLRVHPDKHPRITEQYGAGLQHLVLDPDITKLLLRNLISNAVKYTPADGSIEVSIDTITASSRDEADRLRIVVRDNGYGIPESVSGKVFSKFFRADNAAHHDTDGTGLGLYTVKGLLDYIGGQISFSSRENKGTTFTVILPLNGTTKQTASNESNGIGVEHV